MAITSVGLVVVSLRMRFPHRSKASVCDSRNKHTLYTLATRHALKFNLKSLIICTILYNMLDSL